MTYIKLEDVQNTLVELIQGLERVKETGGKPYSIVLGPVIQDLIQLGIDINSLPSINPEAMIEEMIEELACSYDVEVNSKIGKIAIDSHIQLLKELLQKFKY